MNKYKIQVVLICGCVLVWFLYGNSQAISALYGGLASLVNTWLIELHTTRQKLKLAANATQSLKMLISSMIIRMSAVVILLAIGFWLLKLPPEALIVGFVAGQLGFLLDRGFSGTKQDI